MLPIRVGLTGPLQPTSGETSGRVSLECAARSLPAEAEGEGGAERPGR